MRVALLIPETKTLAGWRSLGYGIISALDSHPDVSPILIVNQDEVDEFRRSFPHLTVILAPSFDNLKANNPYRFYAELFNAWLRFHLIDFKQLEVDIVHSLAAYPLCILGDWLSNRLDVPHVMTVAGTYGVFAAGQTHHARLYRQTLSHAASIFPISNGTKRILCDHFGDWFEASSLKLIHLGTSYVEQVNPKISEARVLPDTPLVLSVGGIKRRKGYHFSIPAFAKVKKNIPNARYIIVGGYRSDSYFDELNALIAKLGVTNSVQIKVGVSESDLHALYQESSLFILTPEHHGHFFEGFGLVYLEAGAFGLPVVGTNSGGVPDAISDGRSGYVVAEKNVDEIAEKMERLLSDKMLNRTMGWQSRKWAEKFTWERFACQQVEAYLCVLEK